eukprot:SAG25_NODE_5004_length_716_cov_1.484603_1_plen_116_part_01
MAKHQAVEEERSSLTAQLEEALGQKVRGGGFVLQRSNIRRVGRWSRPLPPPLLPPHSAIGRSPGRSLCDASRQGPGGKNPKLCLRVRVEIMGSPQCRIVGKYQSVLIMIDPMIFTR